MENLEQGKMKTKDKIVSFEGMSKNEEQKKSKIKLKKIKTKKKYITVSGKFFEKINSCYEIKYFLIRIFNIKYLKKQEKIIINALTLHLKVIK